MANKGERVHGYDLFRDEPLAQPRAAALLESVGVASVCSLYPVDSRKVEIAPCRFLHVDGSHEYGDALADMLQGNHALGQFGVVCVDDYMDAAFPQVAEAVASFIAMTQFRPFAASRNKLFLARTPRARQLLQGCVPERGFVRAS